MSRSTKITVENTDRGYWTYLQRSAGSLPATHLHKILNWVLEQLNFSNFETEEDRNGDVVSLTLGRKASAAFQSVDDAIEESDQRLFAIDLSGIMAQSRESGISPEYVNLPKMVSQQITEWGERNTEFHYAFELITVLARLNKKTFNLEAPPITGRAPVSVVSYLRESTRCWLYGFHGASVALSRAGLEDTLKTKIRTHGETKLENLIDEAELRGVLDACLVRVAHSIRKMANKFLHGEAINERDSRETLDGMRSIVEQVFSS